MQPYVKLPSLVYAAQWQPGTELPSDPTNLVEGVIDFHTHGLVVVGSQMLRVYPAEWIVSEHGRVRLYPPGMFEQLHMSVELAEKAATTEGLDFTGALQWLREGRVVARKLWAETRVLYRVPREGVNTLVSEHPSQRILLDLPLLGEDILATDWVLVADYDWVEAHPSERHA